MPSDNYQKESLTEKVKHVLHMDKPSDVGPAGGDRTDPTVAHDNVKAARIEHELMEAEAEKNIHAREVEQAHTSNNPRDFQPPVVTNPRGPLSSMPPRDSLDHAAHGGARGPALPDLQGGTHIPEKELHRRHHASMHTALRPSDPNDPTAMDGAGDPRSAGDDMAI